MRERFEASPSEPITRRDIESLPMLRRMAWGAGVVERVMSLYSDYFLKTYRQRECLEYAWAFAGGKTDDREKGNVLADSVAALAEDAEEDGYPMIILGMGGSLAEEAWSGSGKALLNSIRSAAYAFAVSRLHRQGISGLDPTVPVAYLESLQPAFYEMALEALAVARKPEAILDRDVIALLPMDLTVHPIAPDRLLKMAHTTHRPEVPPPEKDPSLP
jgi:hypothetical protein